MIIILAMIVKIMIIKTDILIMPCVHRFASPLSFLYSIFSLASEDEIQEYFQNFGLIFNKSSLCTVTFPTKNIDYNNENNNDDSFYKDYDIYLFSLLL